MGKTAPRKPRKGGVLFVKVPVELLEALDAREELERASHPGRTVTRSDVVRELLWGALKEGKRA